MKSSKVLISAAVLPALPFFSCSSLTISLDGIEDSLLFPSQNNDSKVVKSASGYGINEKPNVVFILLDDAGFGDISANGQKSFRTLNIDKIAENGINFVNHYASAPVCAPSRCGLMTGKHTGHAVIRGNKELGAGTGLTPSILKKEGQAGIEGEYTLATLFKENGYSTGMVGKWGLGINDGENKSSPLDMGFDYFYGHLCQRAAHSYFPTHVWENNEKVVFEKNYGVGGNVWLHNELEKKSLAWLDDKISNSSAPFFFMGTYTIPHGALQIPSDALYDENFHPYKNESWWKKATPDMKRYAIMMHRVDLTVGKIYKLLEDSGKIENTIFIFSSDNGPADEYGANPNYFESAGRFGEARLRGIKRAVYEGGIKVPLLVSWPKKIVPQAKSNHLICASYDFMATFAHILSFDINAKTKSDGISILPTLLADEQNQLLHKSLYWEFQAMNAAEGGGPKQALRIGSWKAVLNYGVIATPVKPASKNIELYNLDIDPSETKNLSKFFPNIAEQMKSLLAENHSDSPIFKQILNNDTGNGDFGGGLEAND